LRTRTREVAMTVPTVALAANGGHAVDLEEPIFVHQPGDLDGGAGRAVRAQEPIPRRRDDRAVAHVTEVPVDLHDVADARAAAAQDAMDVLEHLLRLCGGVAFADQGPRLVDRDLTGHVD